MNKDILLTQYSVMPEKLLEYGFLEERGVYSLKKDLNQDLYVIITISKNSFCIDVFEKEIGEKYLPFYIKNTDGTYVNNLKHRIEVMLHDILDHCFQTLNIRNQIISYVKTKYGTIPEYSWSEHPNYFTLKTKNKKKWYGLVLDISYRSLGLNGEEMVDVINLKNNPEKIQNLIDYKNYFPAYHMNKKYWITVLLNQHIDFSLLKQLIDESYQSIEP